MHSETGLLSLGREGGGGENTGSAGPWASLPHCDRAELVDLPARDAHFS